MKTLSKLFDCEELPNFKIYETSHKVVQEYMDKNNVKIDVVAAELETSKSVLYRQLNPSDTAMPISADRIIAITKLTNNIKIIECMANEFGYVLCKPESVTPNSISEANAVLNMYLQISTDMGRLSSEITKGMEDGIIDHGEKDGIISAIRKARTKLAVLEQTLLQGIDCEDE